MPVLPIKLFEKQGTLNHKPAKMHAILEEVFFHHLFRNMEDSVRIDLESASKHPLNPKVFISGKLFFKRRCIKKRKKNQKSNRSK